MELQITLEGESSVEETADLKSWLHRQRITDVSAISQKEQPPAPGELGPTLLAILGVVLASKAAVELVRSIHRWIETRKRKIKIVIEAGGKKITIECENPQNFDTLVRQMEGALHD